MVIYNYFYNSEIYKLKFCKECSHCLYSIILKMDSWINLCQLVIILLYLYLGEELLIMFKFDLLKFCQT